MAAAQAGGSARSADRAPGRPRPAPAGKFLRHLPGPAEDEDPHAALPLSHWCRPARPRRGARAAAATSLVVEIPAHGPLEPLVERDRGPPAQFVADPVGVDRIARVVARAGRSRRRSDRHRMPFARAQPVEDGAELADKVDVSSVRSRRRCCRCGGAPRSSTHRAAPRRDPRHRASRARSSRCRRPGSAPRSALRITTGISFSGKWNGP
jgi:hypothetical protein